MAKSIPWRQAAAVFAGGSIGTAARAGVLALVADQALALAVVNLCGCLALGALAGGFGKRNTWMRTFLAVGCVASFTSWSSLALQGIGSPAATALVMVETGLGIGAAGLGHLAGRRLR